MRFGVDQVVRDPTVLGRVRRVGLVTNDAARLATDAALYARVALGEALRAAGVELVRLFGPEHGLSGTAADGAAVADDVDPLTGLPTISLYGTRMRPAPEHVRDLDAVLFDIPDVGARFYTYTWTLFHLLAESESSGIPVVVLDRPNPLGGVLALAEGPMLDREYQSFIGEADIPIRHQLTLGELARLWHIEHFPQATVRVVPCSGWVREMMWTETSLPWVPTSPAMPSFASAELYPGICLFEATNLSVGRGTPTPFQLIGAPWLDADRVIKQLTGHTALALSICAFTPSHAPYAGETCRGIRLARPHGVGIVADAIALLAAVMQTHRTDFAWSTYPTAANPTGGGHFERLIGNGAIRAHLDEARSPLAQDVVAAWTAPDGWCHRVESSGALLYTSR